MSEAEGRVLEFCKRYPVWHLIAGLDSLRLLKRGDIAAVSGLLSRGDLAWGEEPPRIRITSSGDERIGDDTQYLNAPADRMAEIARQFMHGQGEVSS